MTTIISQTNDKWTSSPAVGTVTRMKQADYRVNSKALFRPSPRPR